MRYFIKYHGLETELINKRRAEQLLLQLFFSVNQIVYCLFVNKLLISAADKALLYKRNWSNAPLNDLAQVSGPWFVSEGFV
jgi:hypothetical protein